MKRAARALSFGGFGVAAFICLMDLVALTVLRDELPERASEVFRYWIFMFIAMLCLVGLAIRSSVSKSSGTSRELAVTCCSVLLIVIAACADIIVEYPSASFAIPLIMGFFGSAATLFLDSPTPA